MCYWFRVTAPGVISIVAVSPCWLNNEWKSQPHQFLSPDCVTYITYEIVKNKQLVQVIGRGQVLLNRPDQGCCPEHLSALETFALWSPWVCFCWLLCLLRVGDRNVSVCKNCFISTICFHLKKFRFQKCITTIHLFFNLNVYYKRILVYLYRSKLVLLQMYAGIRQGFNKAEYIVHVNLSPIKSKSIYKAFSQSWRCVLIKICLQKI